MQKKNKKPNLFGRVDKMLYVDKLKEKAICLLIY